MREVKDRLRALDQIQAPDLRERIRSWEPRAPRTEPSVRRVGIALLAFVVAAAGIAFAIRAFRATEQSTRPAAMVENGEIAFVSETESDLYVYGTQSGIFVVSPDGSGRASIVDDPTAFEWDPAWSPDGTRIAFGLGGEAAERPSGLYVANSDGSGWTLLLEDYTGPTSPSWSPDGRKIVFESGLGHEQTGSGNRDVFVMEVETGEVTRLTDDPARDEYPALSPDGSKIAFTRQQDGVVDIYLMNADGTAVTQLTSGFRPNWSPEGTRIAFERNGDIYVMNADGTGLMRLTVGPADDWEPAWSPDGTKIAFQRDNDLYVMNPDGTAVTRLTKTPEPEGSPAWQPVFVEEQSPGPTETNPPPVEPAKISQSVELRFGELGGITSAIEGFGSLWVSVITNEGEEELLRVDPASGEVVHTFPLTNFPGREWGGGGLAIGGGWVWVAGADLSRLDPTTNTVEGIALEGRAVSDVAFDEQSGRLWALVAGPDNGAGQMVEIDAATGEVVSAHSFEAEWYGGIVPAAGTAWVVEREVERSTVQGGELVQIVPGSATSVATGGSFAEAVTDGTSIWAPFYGDDLAMNLASGIARIDPSTGRVVDEWKTGPIGYDVAVGDDRGIWFLGNDGLSRLNLSTGEVDVSVHVRGTPIFIVPSLGGLWVGTYEGDLLRFDVST